jgi:hypothetical protein
MDRQIVRKAAGLEFVPGRRLNIVDNQSTAAEPQCLGAVLKACLASPSDVLLQRKRPQPPLGGLAGEWWA